MDSAQQMLSATVVEVLLWSERTICKLPNFIQQLDCQFRCCGKQSDVVRYLISIVLPKEVIVKKVPTPAFMFYIGSAFLIGYGTERLSEVKYFAGITLIVLGIGFFFLRKLEPKRSKELIKITDEKLWTRIRGNKPWNTIICIKFRYNERRTVYMDVYRSNEVVADEEVDLHGINMPVWRLKWILKKYVRVENH